MSAGFSPVPDGFPKEMDLSLTAVSLTFEGTPKTDPGQGPGQTVPSDGTQTQVVNGVAWVYTIKDGIAILGYNTKDNYTPGPAAISTATAGKVVIPSTFEGCPLQKIGSDSFNKCENLTEIVIPDSVTEIGRYAFDDCRKLTKLDLPPNIVSIGWAAFSGCESLAKVEIPASVTSISSNPFLRCKGLQDIVIQAGNASYQSLDGLMLSKAGTTLIAFPGGRQDVSLPQGVTKLDYEAFYGVATKCIRIPATIREMGTWVFGYSDVEEVEFGVSLSKIPEYTCISCKSLAKVTLHDGLTEIGEASFRSCSSLDEIAIPKSVSKIGETAFEYCYALSRVDFAGAPPAAVASNAFSHIHTDCVGTYVAEFASEWARVIDSKGLWKGLKMEQVGSAAKVEETTVTLSQGWNWISMNIMPTDPEFSSVFNGVAFADNDIIKSSDGSATYYGGMWYPSPETFVLTPGRAYAVKRSTAGTATVKASGVAASMPLAVGAGWNWIGPTAAAAVPLEELRHSAGFANEDIINSSNGSATYYDGKWYGDLKSLAPGVGYKARFGKAGSLSWDK